MTTRISPRRDFVRCALVAPLVAACADVVSPEASGGVLVTASEVRIDLARTPSLGLPGGSLLVREAAVIVLRDGGGDYRAFSAVCPHAGCGIDDMREGRMRCPCHGSEFGADGGVVVGPAREPLVPLPVSIDAARGLLVVSRPTPG